MDFFVVVCVCLVFFLVLSVIIVEEPFESSCHFHAFTHISYICTSTPYLPLLLTVPNILNPRKRRDPNLIGFFLQRLMDKKVIRILNCNLQL